MFAAMYKASPNAVMTQESRLSFCNEEEFKAITQSKLPSVLGEPMDKLQVRLMDIGPKEAMGLLELNTANFRSVDQKRVALYSKEMVARTWVEANGDTIKVGSTGVILDGQHRLWAVVKSGATIRMFIASGIKSDGREIDRNKPRTIAQWCTSQGIKDASRFAATARLCMAYTKGLWGKSQIQISDITDSEIYEFSIKNKGRIEDCVAVSRYAKPVISQSLLSTVLYFGCGKRNPSDVELAVWFCKSLGKGEGLTEDDAVLHLRNRMTSQTKTSSIDRSMKRALLTMAWNKTALGEACTPSALRMRLTGPAKQAPPSVILELPGS